MSFRPRDFIAVAERLLEAAKSGKGSASAEALSRASAGRSYYALFGELISYVEGAFGEKFKPPGVHSQLQSFLNSEKHDGRFRGEAKALGRLRELREHADYDSGRPFAVELANQSLSEARQILGKKRTQR